jgi:hypothetical protein
VTLAYVFSHRPADGVDIADYEAALKRFHASLAGSPPAGFIGSSTFRTGDRYSDWYLVQSSAALDFLNEDAVSGARRQPHDAAARMAVDFAGKLYGLSAGEPLLDPGYEIRFSKPAGMGYADLYERMKQYTIGPGASLWRRMMVLGPPPEFCLIAPTAVELPGEFRSEVLSRDPI